MICLKCNSGSVVKARLILHSGIAYDVKFCQACEHITRVGDSRVAAAYEKWATQTFTTKPKRKGGDK